MIERWAQLARQMHDFLSALSDDDLNRDIEFAFGDGPKHVRTLGDLMRHAANHSVHHRGQVGLLLRMLGVAPGNVDYLFYTAEARQ